MALLTPSTHQISVGLGTMIKALLLFLAVVLLYQLRDLVMALALSIVIASAVMPIAQFFKRYRIPHLLSVVLVFAAAFGVLLVLIPYLIFPLLGDLSDLLVSLPSKIGHLPLFMDSTSYLGSLYGKLGGGELSLAGVLARWQQSVSALPQGFVQTASLLFGGFFSFILVIVFSFYLSVQPDGINNFLRIVTPLKQEAYIIDVWRRSQQKIGYWMQGQVLLGVLIGVMVFLGLTILQVKYALVLAVLAAVFELIPFFGPVLSAVPGVLFGFSDSVTLGFIVLGFYIIIQQFENHLIQPLVVEKMIGVPPMVVIIAILVGAQLAGVVGMILAIPVAVVLMELLGDWEKQKLLSANNA
jgi:predicted PurR-regulated permease PerM